MSDAYLNFTNTKFGAKLTSMLGLPRPSHLPRYQKGDASSVNDVLIATATEHCHGTLFKTLSDTLHVMDVSCLAHISAAPLSPSLVNKEAQKQTDTTAWSVGQQVDAIVLDASELANSVDAVALYDFFSATVKSVRPNGRVLVFGKPPVSCANTKQAAVQRALEGLTRSLAKELGHGITTQLIYVRAGAEQNIESTLRFFLSARSAYVSGQVININSDVALSKEVDWQTPLGSGLSRPKILVTGASRGIGLAIAEVLARDGAHVVCLDIPSLQSALTKVAERLNGSQILLDLSTDDAPQQLLEQALSDGGWDAIVHNAGITKDKTIAKMSEAAWSSVVQINLSSQEKINDILIENGGLNTGGRIVCVSSISGIAGNRGQTNYAFSKAGVIGMVKACAPVFEQKGYAINAVAPGFIETDMTAAMPFAVREAGRRLNSLSQGGLPIDVAETIAWLVNPASRGLTGNVVRVCGQSLLGA